MVTNATTPVGRIVQGDVYKRTVPPRQGNQPQKVGADGQPASSYFLAIAVPKNDPAWPAYKAKLDAEARISWPQFFDPAGNLINPHFANKITDGDGIDKNGKRNADKEGFAGCWVVKFASSLPTPPRAIAWDHQMGAWVETTTIKCGDYVSVNADCLTNGSTQSPGMYMNPRQVAFEREGALIVPVDSGPTATEAFGTRGPPAAGTVTPPATVPPYSGYMDPAAAPPPPPGAPPPPPATGPAMTAKAGGKTYQAFITAGWTHAQLVEQGYVAA